MTYNALVEEWPGEYSVYFRELPGCVVSALTFEELDDKLPQGVADHLSWLARWGLADGSATQDSVVIAERVPAIPVKDDLAGPIFQADLAPVTVAEVDYALRVAELARAELMRHYSNMPFERREEPSAPGEWSTAEHLRHLAESEVWYVAVLERSGEGISVELPPDPLAALDVSAAHADAVLQGLGEEDRSRVYERNGVQWTAAKVLRRLVGHLREHYPWVAAM